LSKNALPVHLPIGFEKDINGVVDLVDMKAYTYGDFTDHELVQGEVPADMLEKAKNARSLLVEAAVEADDALMEKFFEHGEEAISVDELKAALRKRVLAGDFYLVTGGDGRGVIVEKVLDLMVDYLPSPLDVDAIWGKNPKTGDEVSRKPDDKEPMAALAFKLATDPFVGKLIFVRVYSGVLTAGSYVLNTTTGEKSVLVVSSVCTPTSVKMSIRLRPVTLPQLLASKAPLLVIHSVMLLILSPLRQLLSQSLL
jgi:elongation factor G